MSESTVGGAGDAGAGRDLQAHRRFGAQFNNEVWQLLDAGLGPDSPPSDRELALSGAYASARHWRECGTAANIARAQHLIARTALALGLHDLGLEHARRCLGIVLDDPQGMADWDLPFAHEAMARALAATGDAAAGREHRRAAEAAALAVVDPDDRGLVLEQLQVGPWFGLDDPVSDPVSDQGPGGGCAPG